MKFIINREALLTPLQHIVSVIEKKQTMPILSNVLLVLKENQLIMTGSDLEIQIVARLAVDNNTTAEITLPARKLLDICRLLPAGADIKIEWVEDKVKVTSGRSRFALSTLPAEDYPEFSESEFKHQFSINAGKLKTGLEKTLFCMASQDVRYYLNGLMLNVSNSKIKLVASDGHRLAVFEDELEQPAGFESRIILPRKGVMELSRLLTDNEAELDVRISNNSIKIEIRDLVFSAKLVDARYPDFNRVFQQEFNTPIQIQSRLLKDALTRVAILANEKFKGVSLEINNDGLKISTHNPEHEQAEEQLLIDYPGESLVIAFNVQYLLDAVSNLDSELAVLLIARNLSSCIVEEPETQAYKFIVMPMRL